jgi:iron-sulfur cluster repair protein YtfE (RIC family)
MKRHPALEPFSRDHNLGLILARKLQHPESNAVEEFLTAWDLEIASHFVDEEELLMPVIPEEALATRLLDEHRLIRNLVACLPRTAEQVGSKLEAHIRWEERSLFPAIESGASDSDMRELARRTNEVERQRWKSGLMPDRERLALARKKAAENN